MPYSDHVYILTVLTCLFIILILEAMQNSGERDSESGDLGSIWTFPVDENKANAVGCDFCVRFLSTKWEA